MRISISIVAYNSSRDDLALVIGCAAKIIPLHTIYVVDNSPSDGIRGFVNSITPKVEYIYGQGNVGFGAAHNIAIAESIKKGIEYHIVLNPDIEFKEGVVESLIKFMDENLDVGLVVPKVLYPNGELQYLCKLLPTPSDWIFRRFVPFRNIVGKRNKRYEMHFSGYDKIMNVPYLSGCFMFFRVSILQEIGLFDEKIFMYGEDTDITRRIYRRHKAVFYPYVLITHRHNKGSYRNFRLLWIHIKAAVYYFNKWGWFFDAERKNINSEVVKKYNINQKNE